MTDSSYAEPLSFVRTLTRGYAALILMLLGSVPIFAIAYLHYFQDPALRFEHHGFHEITISISLGENRMRRFLLPLGSIL